MPCVSIRGLTRNEHCKSWKCHRYILHSVVSLRLGPSQDGSDIVMEVMVAAQDGGSLKSGAGNVDDEFDSWSLKTSRDDFIDAEHPVEASLLRYIRALLARPYWERLWILQLWEFGSKFSRGYAVDWNIFAESTNKRSHSSARQLLSA